MPRKAKVRWYMACAFLWEGRAMLRAVSPCTNMQLRPGGGAVQAAILVPAQTRPSPNSALQISPLGWGTTGLPFSSLSVNPWSAAMPDSIHAPCPLCNLQCTAYLEDYGKWMHFSCRCCRELKVNKMVISKLRAESIEVREQLSQQARALGEGEYLHIAATDQGSLQPRGQSAWTAEVRTRPV